jgi:hypothetical protein
MQPINTDSTPEWSQAQMYQILCDPITNRVLAFFPLEEKFVLTEEVVVLISELPEGITKYNCWEYAYRGGRFVQPDKVDPKFNTRKLLQQLIWVMRKDWNHLKSSNELLQSEFIRKYYDNLIWTTDDMTAIHAEMTNLYEQHRGR